MMRRIAHEVKSLAHGKYVIGAFGRICRPGIWRQPRRGCGCRHKTPAKCWKIAD